MKPLKNGINRMDPISATVGSAVIGGGASIYGANKAASAQKKQTNAANALQQEMYDRAEDNLNPYMQTGLDANTELQNRLQELTSPVVMDQTALEQTPGYQFTRDQGLKAVQNSAASRGLGISGASYKGAANYATGLADSTYQNQFNNAITNQGNAYNRLMGISGMGQNAAGNLAGFGQNSANQQGQNLTSLGNAQGASYMTQANALGNAFQSVPDAMYTNKLLGMYGNPNNGLNYSNYANGGSTYGTN